MSENNYCHTDTSNWQCVICKHQDEKIKELENNIKGIELGFETYRKLINENVSNLQNRIEKLESIINNSQKWCRDLIASHYMDNDKKIEKLENKPEPIFTSDMQKDVTQLMNRVYRLEEVLPRYDHLHKEWMDRIERLEKSLSNCCDIQMLYTMRSTIETWQKGCEVLISDLQKNVMSLSECNKKPHKCPICEGKGSFCYCFDGQLVPTLITCKSCEGKGILWN